MLFQRAAIGCLLPSCKGQGKRGFGRWVTLLCAHARCEPVTPGDKAADMADVEETLKRIQGQKGVQGIIIVNAEGIPIKSTMDNATTAQYAGLMHHLVTKARCSLRDIDPQNDLTFLRLRSKKNEIMIAPDKDYMLVVIQQPSE